MSQASSTLAPTLLQCSRRLRVLVTGAGRGLGRGLARQLIVSGHDVFLLDNDEKELQHTLQEHLPKASSNSREPYANAAGRFQGAICNVGDSNSIKAALRQARTFIKDGKFDVLVNNAARTGPYWQSTPSLSEFENDPLDEREEGSEEKAIVEEWHSYLDTNLSGAFMVTRMCLGMLRHDGKNADGGQEDDFQPTVIFVSSTRAKQSEANSEPYASTKAGLLGLTHSLASSLQPLHIRSNAILPGWIPSGHESIEGDKEGISWSSGLTEEDHSQHWSGRVGRIEDLSNAVLFLASTRFMNGQEIVLDGGMSRKMQYVE